MTHLAGSIQRDPEGLQPSWVTLTCQKSAIVWDSGPCVAMYAGIRGSCSIWSGKGGVRLHE